MPILTAQHDRQVQPDLSLKARKFDGGCRIALSTLISALLLVLFGTWVSGANAQSCPFDDGNSSLEVEGLILTRYALGLTGAPLVANTGIATVDAPAVEATISCPSCGLNITGNPTLTVADATIISRKLAGFSGSALTDNVALGSGSRNTPAAVQSFLLSGCGTVAAANVRPPFRLNANVGSPGSGKYSSMAIGADGLPLIAFYNQTTADLQIAKCTTIDCESATISTLDSAGDVGQFPSLGIGSDGFGVMSYYDASNGDLKLAKCSNITCSTAAITTVDSTNNSGKFSSLVVSDNLPRIAYYDATVGALKYARCNDGTCSGPIIETVANTGDVGQWAAITLVDRERPMIAYFDATSRTLNVAVCVSTNGACALVNTYTVDIVPAGNIIEGIAISTGRDGFAVMSYETKTTAGGSGVGKIAVCNNTNCTSSVIRTGFPGGNALTLGSFTSVSVGPDGLPLAMFNNSLSGASCEALSSASAQPTIVKCLTPDCATTTAVVPTNLFMISPSITHGVDGMPIIAGRKCDPAPSRLATIHCSNATCSGRYRPR